MWKGTGKSENWLNFLNVDYEIFFLSSTFLYLVGQLVRTTHAHTQTYLVNQTDTYTHSLTCSLPNHFIFWRLVGGVNGRESHTHIIPHTTHTVHSDSSGYECTDKVYSLSESPAAPSASDMQKIVMPDLFDMKRWEGNITGGNVW